MNPLLLLVRLLGAGSFAFAIYYDIYELELPDQVSGVREEFGGHAKYLTFLNMCLQCLFFTLCILADFGGEKSVLARVRDVMFATAAFPIGMFVGIIFWGLWAVDRELIFPARLDEYFPSWLNHLMHTTVVPLQAAELFLASHVYPSRLVGGGINMILIVGYLIWLHVIFYYGGFWVYPVFQVLTPSSRPVFFVFCIGCGASLYYIGELLNTLLWSKAAPMAGDVSKKTRKSRKEN